MPEAWIVLLTDTRAEFGKYRIAVLAKPGMGCQQGKPTFDLEKAAVFASEDEARCAAGLLRGQWLPTLVPAGSPGVPALPWA